MTTTFQEQLLEIQSQISELEGGEEETTKASAIEPLLNFCGWKTSHAKEVARQYRVAKDKNDKVDYALKKVDYALKLDGDRRVFIEAKKWSAKLEGHEEQLRDYCNAATAEEKPELAVLTNGRQWRLYLPPVKDHPELRRFLEFDITTDKPDEVEQNLKEFLAHDRIKSMKKPPRAAYERWRQIIEDEEVKAKLSNAWNKLAKSQKEQAEVLSLVVKYLEIQAEEEHLKNFLKSSGPLFNAVTVTPEPTHPKPISFTFRADGKEETFPVEHWYDIHFSLCEIMYDLHPDTFSRKVIAISDAWFSEVDDGLKEYLLIEGSGIYVKKSGANAKTIKPLCYKIVARFGHSRDSLTIQET